MQEEMTLTDVHAARALRDTPYLNLFLNPTSPSEAGRKLNMPANLVHHHARRLSELGLLVEVGRQGGRVLYQLAARTIKYDRSLLESGESEGHTLHRVSRAFLSAFERSDRLAQRKDPDYAVYTFRTEGPHPVPPQAVYAPEAHPAHLQVRTLHLTPDRYQELVGEFYARLGSLASDDAQCASPCSFVFLAFDGSATDEASSVKSDSHSVSSFVPLQPAQAE